MPSTSPGRETRHGNRSGPEVSGDGDPGQVSAAVSASARSTGPGVADFLRRDRVDHRLRAARIRTSPPAVVGKSAQRQRPQSGSGLECRWLGDGRGEYGCRDPVAQAEPASDRSQGRSRPALACPPSRGVAGTPEPQARRPLRGEAIARRMFIDTNVLVNSRILEAPDHDTAQGKSGTSRSKP